ncbi:MAG: hypothetical protein NTV52_07735 [Acidobacteria bacterium]|nr:hypothetical protein [Acidobacteriota bacterium]
MRVHFDGLIATPLYVTPNQLRVVAPPGIAGARETNGIVEMKFDWGHPGDPRRCKVRFWSS